MHPRKAMQHIFKRDRDINSDTTAINNWIKIVLGKKTMLTL